MAPSALTTYPYRMKADPKLVEQWRYLRGLLLEQLEAFETGALQVHANQANVSEKASEKVRRSIAEFDALLAAEESSDA